MIDQAIQAIRGGEIALTGKKQPVIAYRHGHWLFITLGYVFDAHGEMRQGIVGLNFMSPRRAKETIADWLPYSTLKPLDEVLPFFRQELAAKALPTAEDYRPLLQKGLVRLVGGFTTDTLEEIEREEDGRVELIARWMRKGDVGPFLHFDFFAGQTGGGDEPYC